MILSPLKRVSEKPKGLIVFEIGSIIASSLYAVGCFEPKLHGWWTDGRTGAPAVHSTIQVEYGMYLVHDYEYH